MDFMEALLAKRGEPHPQRHDGHVRCATGSYSEEPHGALPADLPRLANTLLADVPEAVPGFLAPLLQLKSALEGNA